MLEFWKAIITTALRSLLGWPVAIVFLGLLLRKEISGLLERFEHFIFRRGDMTFEALARAAAIQGSELPPPVESNGRLPDAPGTLARQQALDFARKVLTISAVKFREENIRKALATISPSLSPQETIDTLIANLAYSQAAEAGERLYRIIFGSQIGVLKLLNVSPRPKGEIKSRYSEAKTAYPSLYSTYSYQNWCDFLLTHGLITSNAEKDTFEITQQGRDFLIWMVNKGLPEMKFG